MNFAATAENADRYCLSLPRYLGRTSSVEQRDHGYMHGAAMLRTRHYIHPIAYQHYQVLSVDRLHLERCFDGYHVLLCKLFCWHVLEQGTRLDSKDLY